MLHHAVFFGHGLRVAARNRRDTMTYHIAETDATGYVNDPSLWTPTRAASLASAKRAATAGRRFQCTAAHVAVQLAGGRFEVVAICRPDCAINMNSARHWINL
jgi:hypothetical protein